MRYCYSLIRFVPDPVRGEFVNVGAVVGSEESSEWAVRQVDNPLRARHLDERGTLPAVFAFIDRVGREIDAYEEIIERGGTGETDSALSEEWLTSLHRGHTNIVQLSEPLPVLAESLDEAVETIFAQLIVDPAKRPGGSTKHPALAAMRRAYNQAGLAARVVQGAVLEAEGHRERLDFGVANGRVVQITQAWSFQVADQDSLAKYVRAWGWAVKAAQDSGGRLRTADQTMLEVPRDVDVEVVYIPPNGHRDTSALADARSVFGALGATEVALADASHVAERAAALLGGPTQPVSA
jgi:hypothetical protein